MQNVIAIDIGGTEIKGGIVDNLGNITKFIKTKTNAKNGFAEIKNNIDYVLTELVSRCPKALAIGVASAGNIDNINSKVVYATDNLPGFTGFEIGEYISEKYDKKVCVDNDVYSALYGELMVGNGKNYQNVAIITLGTGVGGGFCIDRQIVRGKNFTAGRFGHMVLYPNGLQCNCGQNGCAEQYISGTAFTKGAMNIGLEITHGSQVFDSIAKGNEAAFEYAKAYFKKLATLIQSIENSVSPELLLIGGGLINSKDIWWDKIFLPLVVDSKIKFLPALLGNDAGIIGAAYQAFEMIENVL